MALVGVRLAMGQWSVWDLVSIAAAWLLQPFVEWLIHVFILHAKPMSIGPWTIDLPPALHHRLHHRDPWDIRHTIMPISALIPGTVVIVGAWLLLMPTLASAVTGLVCSAVMSVAYEWVHFLIHSSYRPRGKLYMHLWRMHRFHHFKNEHYWMGVTRTFADRVLGTNPAPGSVESSKTARNLNGDSELDNPQ